MVDVADAYNSLPIVTRIYVTLVILVSLLCALDVSYLYSIGMSDLKSV